MPITVPAVVLLVAVLCLAIGLRIVVRSRRLAAANKAFIRAAHSTEAMTVDLVRHNRRRYNEVDQAWFHPVVEFTTADGREVRTESLTGAFPAPASPGETVPILYDPQDPEQVMVNRGLAKPGATSATMGCLGGLLIAIGIAGLPLAALTFWIHQSTT